MRRRQGKGAKRGVGGGGVSGADEEERDRWSPPVARHLSSSVWFTGLSVVAPEPCLVAGEAATVVLRVHGERGCAEAVAYDPVVVRAGAGPRLNLEATPLAPSDAHRAFEDPSVALAYEVRVPLEEAAGEAGAGWQDRRHLNVALSVVDSARARWEPQGAFSTSAALSHELRVLSKALCVGRAVAPEQRSVTFAVDLLKPLAVASQSSALAPGRTRILVTVRNDHADRCMDLCEYDFDFDGDDDDADDDADAPDSSSNNNPAFCAVENPPRQ